MFKKFFEDLVIDEVESFGKYEVTKEEIIDFASKYDPQPFHLDEEIAKQSVFGTLCASGWHTCGMMMRMIVDRMMDEGMAGMGSPGVDELKWHKPVLAGDILSVRGRVTHKRDSKSRPNIGLVKSHYEVLNQKGEMVMSINTNVMMLKRNP